MTAKTITAHKLSRILELYALNGLSKTWISRALRISRGTVIKYTSLYEKSDLIYTDLFLNSESALLNMLLSEQFHSSNEKSDRLIMLFPDLHERLSSGEVNLKRAWTEYFKKM